MAGVEVTAVTSPSPISEEVEQRLSIHQLLLLAESVTSEYFAGEVEPVWLATVAYIESGGNPNARRFEPSLGCPSLGLTQVLLVTARWLITDTTPKLPPGKMAHRPVGSPVPRPPEIPEPTQQTLIDPFISMWYGAAYLQYLSIYKFTARDEEWIIRSYNIGPEGVTTKDNDQYYARYVKVKQVIEEGLKACAIGGALYQISSGETLYAIARAHLRSLDELLAANPEISDASAVLIGQLLVIPGKPRPKVAGTRESSPVGTGTSRLRAASGATPVETSSYAGSDSGSEYENGQRGARGSMVFLALAAGCILMAGLGGLFSLRRPREQRTRVRGQRPGRGVGAEAGSVARAPARVPAPQPQGRGKQEYVVLSGDTLWGIAREHGTTVQGIIDANPALSQTSLSVGTRLSIPK
eukprot:jgi/Tetstr1/459231/TSEL_000041.t1